MNAKGQLSPKRSFVSDGWSAEERSYCNLLFQLVRQKSHTSYEASRMKVRFSIHEGLVNITLPLFYEYIFNFPRRTKRAVVHRLRDMLNDETKHLTLQSCVDTIIYPPGMEQYADQSFPSNARKQLQQNLWLVVRYVEKMLFGEVSTLGILDDEWTQIVQDLELQKEQHRLPHFRSWSSLEYDTLSSELSANPERFRLLSQLRGSARTQRSYRVYSEIEQAHLEIVVFASRQSIVEYDENSVPRAKFEIRDKVFAEAFRIYQTIWPVFYPRPEPNMKRKANDLHTHLKYCESLNLESMVQRVCRLHNCPRLDEDILREALLLRAVTLGSAGALKKMMSYCKRCVARSNEFDVPEIRQFRQIAAIQV